MNDQTLIQDLTGPNMWRLRRSVDNYNRTVDKAARIETIADLRRLEPREIKELLGVGKKTLESIQNLLNAPR